MPPNQQVNQANMSTPQGPAFAGAPDPHLQQKKSLLHGLIGNIVNAPGKGIHEIMNGLNQAMGVYKNYVKQWDNLSSGPGTEPSGMQVTPRRPKPGDMQQSQPMRPPTAQSMPINAPQSMPARPMPAPMGSNEVQQVPAPWLLKQMQQQMQQKQYAPPQMQPIPNALQPSNPGWQPPQMNPEPKRPSIGGQMQMPTPMQKL